MCHTDINIFNELALAAAKLYPIADASKIKLLCCSENTTYLIEDQANQAKYVLRIAELDYHTKSELESEIFFMDYIGQNTDIPVPQAISGNNGEKVQVLHHHQIKGDCFGVMFTFLNGRAPDESQPAGLVPYYEKLGEMAAKMHNAAIHGNLAAKVDRFHWTYDAMIGSICAVGDWRDCPDFTAAEKSFLENVCQTIKKKLDQYGTDPERYSLVHADLRLANILVDGDKMALLDFDDCGLGWFLLDYSSALSFLETKPYTLVLSTAWVKGYEKIRQLTAADKAELPTFLLARRLLLQGFLAKHPQSEAVKEGIHLTYAQGTLQLAKTFMQVQELS